ncbi:magnesium-translocating P-type ATPase [Nocardioides sp.]|uniref:magnesium-translocating P-type ATPase n=1 Tax=Nocardioides sp. TaxID=35761 RepID=UPI00260AE652|nr:magnesium-translocating P-type ATPase [Nocardioides sp.]
MGSAQVSAGAVTSEDQAFWATSGDDVLQGLRCTTDGLSASEAADRLGEYGPNRLGNARRSGVWRELLRQFTEPIVVILIGATLLALLLGDTLDASIILVIIVFSGLLGFWQEHGASATVARLLAQVEVRVEVRRDGQVLSVPPEEIVPGDVLVLAAGDLVPSDCRVLSAEALQVDEAALTGESYPRHKHPDPAAADAALADRHSALFQGSHVVSGKGVAVVVATGERTLLGGMSRSLTQSAPPTGFETGMTRFGYLLTRVTLVLTVAILLLNVVLGRSMIEAVLFSLALAIGVTPQMLPAIVSVSLSAGARRLARAQVIVRRLESIEDLGSMDVLCTDKTGTLTLGSLSLGLALDPAGGPSDRVSELAAANAGLQTGYSNPLDAAVLAAHPVPAGWRAIGELPFDFDRKRLAVLVETGTETLLISKGAFDRVLAVCTTVATADGEEPLEAYRSALDAQFQELSSQGYRVLAVATRPMPGATTLTATDEGGLCLAGILGFMDPPKESVAGTMAELADLGVTVCMVTGDNRYAARHVAEAVGFAHTEVLTGAEIDGLDQDALIDRVLRVRIFAELSPTHKERVIAAVRSSGAVVGYLGDGINDAGSLHLADVGISVDTAVDVAKSAAALVLLDKDLSVVAEGVRLGRATFANTLKYVYTTISANFGNTASMAIASAFLPFLPLLPRQILLLNFLSDLPSVTIAGDHVDPEQVRTPGRWDVRQVGRFMVTFGLLSSAFDLVTFALLLQVFDADSTLFRSAWFVGSTLTEIAVLFVLRTRRMALRSRPGRALTLTSIAVGVVVFALPYVGPLADPLGLDALPARVVLSLVGVTVAYVVAAELTKRWFYRAGQGEQPAWPVAPADHRATLARRRLHQAALEHGR